MNRKLFIGALVLGAAVRAAVLPLPGTRDVALWKIWAFNGAIGSPATLYGVGGSPPEHRLLDFHGVTTTVDYPPLSLYELAAVGRLHKALNGGFVPDNTALTVTIKLLLILFEAGFLTAAFLVVRAHAGLAAARWTAAAYWLSPASFFDASVLAYLDPLFVLPLASSLMTAAAGWPLAAGALFSLAVLTKAQAAVVFPALVLAVCNGGPAGDRVHRLGRMAAGGAAAGAIVIAPVVAAGAGPNMLAALALLARHDMLSGNACNLWWIAGYLIRARHSLDLGAWAAFTAPVRILAISRATEIGYPNPRLVGAILTASAMGWALWTARRERDGFLIAAVGAFMVHAYAVLSAQVHENHLFAAVPLLAIAAAGRPRFRPVFWTISAIFALNLNAFYGISEYIDGWAVPRGVTIVDVTVLLAIANCATLAWHAAVLGGECSTAARRPGPAISGP